MEDRPSASLLHLASVWTLHTGNGMVNMTTTVQIEKTVMWYPGRVGELVFYRDVSEQLIGFSKDNVILSKVYTL